MAIATPTLLVYHGPLTKKTLRVGHQEGLDDGTDAWNEVIW